MTPELRQFFDELAPMLASTRSAREVELVLGPCPSGTAALGFYAELVRRNLAKILRDVFPVTRALVMRDAPRRWDELALAYACDHPPTGAVPNRYAASLPSWLASRGADEARWAEIADFEWLRVAAHHAMDGAPDDDGFDRRIFVRQYTFDVPRWIAAHASDPSTPLPAPAPTIAIVFRHSVTGRVGVHRPTAAGLAAIARRASELLPSPLDRLDAATLARAEHALVDAGVLVPKSRNPVRGTIA
jgi:hypothetical protein